MASPSAGTYQPAVRLETEKSLGIIQRSASVNYSWVGDVRKRYSDFLVYEISKDGSVVHLRDYIEDEPKETPKASASPAASENRASNSNGSGTPVIKAPEAIQTLSEDDQQKLSTLLGEEVAKKLIEFDTSVQEKRATSGDSVPFNAITDRSQRANVHQEVRRMFSGRIETVADSTGVITATASRFAIKGPGRNQQGNRGQRRDNNRDNRSRADQSQSFASLGGEYLHLTLYKENKDTMDAVNTIARLLKIKSSNFGFAGTKDRRAATVQRISIHRQRASNLTWINTRIPNIRVGDFQHAKAPIQLGQHGGNEFVITLKNCFPTGGTECTIPQRMNKIQQSLELALAHMKQNGYINYFGLQRFGTYAIGTHTLGMKILKGDYEGFVDDVLHVDETLFEEALAPASTTTRKDVSAHRENIRDNNREDHERARAIAVWKTTKNAGKALEIMPKRFSSETALIRSLGSNPKDYTGAILSITRGLRMMYIHAYQSFVWNFAATQRWCKYGNKPVVGDLVLAGPSKSIDADDEETIHQGLNEDALYADARVLTEEDIASGKYTIFDVILPTPGFDVKYPTNELGKFYEEFMAKEEHGGLSPYDMRRKNREFSLSGSYRTLVGRFITEPQYAIRAYHDDTEQMYPTDLDFAIHNKALAKKTLANKTGVKRPAEDAVPAANAWSHFANNAAVYDNAMADHNRLEAEEKPASDTPAVARETWVQTGLDNSAKRVKLARHHQLIETSATDPISRADTSTPPPTTSEDTASSAQDTPSSTANFALPDGGVSLFPLKTETPMDIDQVSASPVPSIKTEETSPATAVTAVVTDAKADPHDWYGGKVPVPTSPTTGATIKEENNTVEPTACKDSPNTINGVVLPEFHTASDNPLSSTRKLFSDEDIDPKARKIAVILKFQLHSSNYATIVLRELMGTSVE
ncbi:putative pseudouridine synthase [Podospora australis]|uniref:Pseudouridine synthase n=1 Tax=Podospora australis TaxID=1536484 RepID=A0AAN6X5Z7_9PEZI|nr:putative pseudouridine synthase [Podospora australis]